MHSIPRLVPSRWDEKIRGCANRLRQSLAPIVRLGVFLAVRFKEPPRSPPAMLSHSDLEIGHTHHGCIITQEACILTSLVVKEGLHTRSISARNVVHTQDVASHSTNSRSTNCCFTDPGVTEPEALLLFCCHTQPFRQSDSLQILGWFSMCVTQTASLNHDLVKHACVGWPERIRA